MDPRLIPQGGSQEYNYDETNGGRGRAHEPGVYFHPQAQKFVETAHIQRPDGSKSYSVDQGRVQADAFAQMGYRPATQEELKEYQEQQAAKDTARRKEETPTTVTMSDSARK